MRDKFLEALEMLRDSAVKLFDELNDCARAAVNLYGMVTLKDFARIWKDVSGENLDSEKIYNHLRNIMEIYENGKADYFLSGENLVSSDKES